VTPFPAAVFWKAGMIAAYASLGVEYATRESFAEPPPDEEDDEEEDEELPHAASTRAAASTARAVSVGARRERVIKANILFSIRFMQFTERGNVARPQTRPKTDD
jgi:hypothetical protein